MNNNYTDYLAHHGVKGMKWGVRRYQNPDGTRTSRGKKRDRLKTTLKKVAVGTAGIATVGGALVKGGNRYDYGKAFNPTIKGGKDKPNITPAEKAIKNVEGGINDAFRIKNARDRMNKGYDHSDYGASKMSDDQLRKAINRMNLENQYISAMNNRNTSKGKQYADDILDIVGGVAGIAGSAVGTYALMRTIRK